MTTVVGSTHLLEQLSFSMFPSTLAFDFDLMLGSFLTFWAQMGYFWGWGRVRKLFCGLLMLLFNSHFVYFRQFWYLFLLNFGVIFTFWGPNGLFLGLG